MERQGFKVLDHNFINVSYLANPKIYQKIKSSTIPFVFTSQHSIIAIQRMALKNNLSTDGMEAYCIKGTTLEKAKTLHFIVKGVATNALELSEVIINQKDQKLLYCTADMRRDELEKKLIQAGIIVHTCLVYHKDYNSIGVPKNCPLVFFSPSQIDSYKFHNDINVTDIVFCIGPTTGNYAREIGFQNIEISSSSNEESLINCVIKKLSVI